jgi:hypothetical protein
MSSDHFKRIISSHDESFRQGKRLHALRAKAETEKAIGLQAKDTGRVVWFPKSQIDAHELLDGSVLAFVPDWLYQKRADRVRRRFA